MKNRTLSRILSAALSFLLAVSLLTPAASAAGAGTSRYINTRPLATNLDYVNTVYWNDTYSREESYSLVYRAGGDAYPIVMTDDTVYGTVTIDEAMAYAKSLGYNVLAGLNAGFFASNGVPLGLFIEDGIYKSSPAGLPAVVFLEDGSAQIIESPDIVMTLTNLGDGIENLNMGNSLSVTNLNKMRHDYGGMYMFSSSFSTVSTRTSTPGWFVRFEILDGKLTPSGEMRLRVVETFESEGSAPIGEGYLILSASGAANGQYASFAPGDEVALATACSDEALAGAIWGTGCGDILVKDGAVTDSSLWDRDLLERHPRTAVGIRADGTVVSYVLDGRNSAYGNGLPLKELAEEMLALGCVAAVNLDGGGSSVMSVRLPGSAAADIVNRPSDGKARKCSTYILFVTDNIADGTARKLALSNDGTIVLAGSSFELKYAATDSAYRPTGAPGDASAISTALGEVSGGTYTAGQVSGVDKLLLSSSSTGAAGTGEVFVLTHPTSVTAYSTAGTALTSVNISPGGALELNPVATYYRKPVISQPSSFTYGVTGDIGTITPEGVFTAAGQGNRQGGILITAGAQTAVINVTIQGFTDTIGHWAKEFIDELYASGIVTGVTAGAYMPENNIRRSDFILMLYRAAGLPEVSVPLDSFSDVPADAYYAAAVAWAREKGITTGVGDNIFDPLSDLTREQAFTFVYRALNPLKIEVPADFTPSLYTFTDAGEMSEYAVTAADTLIALGVVGGDGGQITPKAPLTRAQMAKILCVTLRGQTYEPLEPQKSEPGEIPEESVPDTGGDPAAPEAPAVPEEPENGGDIQG
ncbi:MAG: hypothetical protein GX823_02825 [Clostridiales bacterium]|nr:hypothetical protein [Clostridiales bacterium]